MHANFTFTEAELVKATLQ